MSHLSCPTSEMHESALLLVSFVSPLLFNAVKVQYLEGVQVQMREVAAACAVCVAESYVAFSLIGEGESESLV